MENRTASIVVTILAVLLIMFPGFAGLCFGLASLVDSILGTGVLANDLNTYLWFILGGICGGSVLILVSIIVIIIALRRKKEVTSRHDEPLPPTI